MATTSTCAWAPRSVHRRALRRDALWTNTVQPFHVPQKVSSMAASELSLRPGGATAATALLQLATASGDLKGRTL